MNGIICGKYDGGAIVRPALPDDEKVFATRARGEDIEEWQMASGRPFIQTIREAVSRPGSTVVEIHGQPIVLFGHSLLGVMASGKRIGAGWLLLEETYRQYIKTLHLVFLNVLPEIADEYDALDAFSYSENTLHHRWMEMVGFVRVGQSVTWASMRRAVFYVYRYGDIEAGPFYDVEEHNV